jgi:protein-tyrosine-phosphatase
MNSTMKEILFVCSGNTCRSPMAEGVAKQVLSKGMPFEVRVGSAGSSAADGVPAVANAVEAARGLGVDIRGHRSRLLNATMVRAADLIVTMGEKHRHTVGVIEPAALSCTAMLTEFCAGLTGDVHDPIGGDLETYQRTLALIEECVERLADGLPDFDGWRRGE